MRKALLSSLLVVMFAAPFVHAQSAEQVQQQIAALLAQISQLQALIQAVEGAQPPATNVSRPANCPIINRTLTYGSEGADVSALQRYLAADPTLYPEGTISGYYGTLTMRAVQKFQARVGAASSGTPETTGYGAVGPRTRAALANCEGLIQANIPYPTTPPPPSVPTVIYPTQPGSNCATPPAQPPAAACGNVWEKVLENGCHTQWRCAPIPPMTVTPNNGPAPLTTNVRFNTRLGDPYEINWGDNSVNTVFGAFNELAPLPKSTVILAPASQPVSVPHTYSRQGTYQVHMRVGSYEEEGDQWVWKVRRFMNTVTVSGSNVADSFEGVSIAGVAPFTASFKATINGDGSCEARTYTLHFGNNTTQELNVNAGECAPKTMSISKSYGQAGFYTARLYRGTPAQVTNGTAPEIGSSNVYLTGGGAASGPFTASVGTGTTWNRVTVNFTLPTSEACSAFELSWGEGTAKVVNNVSTTTPTCPNSTTQKTFTYTYGDEGTYTISLKRGVGNISTFPVETKTANIISPQ